MRAKATTQDQGRHLGERIVFWSWATVLAAGLVLMIVIPLTEM